MLFDSAVDGADNGGSTNSWTFAFNNVGGDTVYVGVKGDTAGSAIDDVTGVTYGGISCTFICKILNTWVNWGYLYVLPNAPKGINNVVISASSAHTLAGCAASYSGGLGTQPDASTTNSGGGSQITTLSTSLTSTVDNCWHLVFAIGFNGAPPGVGAGTTSRIKDAANGEFMIADSNGPKTPAGSVTLTTNYTSAASDITHMMTTIAPLVASVPYVMKDDLFPKPFLRTPLTAGRLK